MTTTLMAPERHSLYRFFDQGGRLLYVGITKTLAVRWRNHSEKEWWPLVASATIEHFEDRRSVEAAEQAAIREELPLHNVLHSTTREIVSVPAVSDPLGKLESVTTGRAAKMLGVSATAVRRWEEAGILAPTRRLPGSGHRRYSKASVEALKKKLSAENA